MAGNSNRGGDGEVRRKFRPPRGKPENCTDLRKMLDLAENRYFGQNRPGLLRPTVPEGWVKVGEPKVIRRRASGGLPPYCTSSR